MKTLTRMFAVAGIAALCAIPQPATAQGWTVTTNGPNGRNWTTSVVPRAGGSVAQIVQVPQWMITDEMMERDRQWVEFCQPRIVAQAPDWVRRYVYKHPGCENGRTE